MEITPERVEQILKIAQEPVSLETPVGDEDDSSLGDFIEDDELQRPHVAVDSKMRGEELQACCRRSRTASARCSSCASASAATSR